MRGRGVVLIFGVVAHALDLMVPETTRKKLELMRAMNFKNTLDYTNTTPYKTLKNPVHL